MRIQKFHLNLRLVSWFDAMLTPTIIKIILATHEESETSECRKWARRSKECF